jgi:hypothetical protein
MSKRVSDEVLSQLTGMVGPDSIYRAMATELIERRAEDDQAKDLLGKGDNLLISRDSLTEWIREAHREWVGLTDEEISAVDWKSNETLHDFARSIEAKFKEKNGG